MALTEEEILKCIELFNKYSDSDVPVVYDTNTKALVNEAYAKFSYDRIRNSTMGSNDIYSNRCINFVKNLWKLLMKWLLDWITPGPTVPPLLDLDGNEYTTVTIGTQEWIVENLRVTKYADGSAIENITVDGVATTYNDWYLPSRDELIAMYDNLWDIPNPLGNFTTTNYWSSSESSATEACQKDFTFGSDGTAPKSSILKVRPSRNFLATVGSYEIGDIGPAGGYIYYLDTIVDNQQQVYEAGLTDLSDSTWSNLNTTFCNGTGVWISYGQENTETIIAQVGHTASAANLCGNYSISIGTGWAGDTVGAYCWYNNDINYKVPYGALYNWYAISNAKGLVHFTRDGIYESGWKIPSTSNWDSLIVSLGGTSVAGGKLKEIGITHWIAPNVGADNFSGLTIVGSGYRFSNGSFMQLMIEGDLWSETEYNTTNAYGRQIQNSSITVATMNIPKIIGLSIRCVRDISSSSNITVDDTSTLSDNTIITVDNG